MTPRRNRLLLGAGTALTLLVSGLAASATVSPAQAAPSGTPECPLAFPATELTPGLEVTGKTTAGHYTRPAGVQSSPETPEPFTGTYLSTVEDPTGDLLIFELAGSRITHPDGSVDAGIWQGISGSPVYAADGRLVGSVSYGFTQIAGSTYAGITPAEDLYGLLEEPTAPAPLTVALSRAERSALTAQGVPARATAHGLTRLSTPTVLAGTRGGSPAMLRALAAKAGRPMPLLAGGTATQERSVPIVAGANVAVADSYGSLALYSVGTATAVCDDVVIGYGHPNRWANSTSTIHGASTTVIMSDGANSSKLANLAAPAGTLLEDRLAGITGRLGALPTTIPVEVTSTGLRNLLTTTQVPNVDALSFIVANQTYRDAAVSIDQMGTGEATVTWEISFTRANGRSQTFTRSQHYASRTSIADEVPADVAGDVEAILENGFEDITITGVKVRQATSRAYRAHRVQRFEVRQQGRWVKARDNKRISIRAGQPIKVRAHLVKADRVSTAAPLTKTFTLTTPRGARGRAMLSLQGNASSFWDDIDELFAEMMGEIEEASDASPKSLDDLLKLLAAQPRQNSLTTSLTGLRRTGPFTRTRHWTLPSTVQGDVTLRVVFKKPAKRR